MKYCWKFYNFSADANKVGKELENITDEDITNKDVLEYAENHRNSELAKCFDWDNESAGRKWRLHEASTILQNISIIIDDSEEPIQTTKVYVNTKKKDEEKRVFKKLVDVLENDEEYQNLLAKAKNDLEDCQNKYRNILELQDLKDIIFDMYKNL